MVDMFMSCSYVIVTVLNVHQRCISSWIGLIRLSHKSRGSQSHDLTTWYSTIPKTAPKMTSLTWCRPSRILDKHTDTDQTMSRTWWTPVSAKWLTMKQVTMTARLAWPLGKEYLSIRIVIMSPWFCEGRWRRNMTLHRPMTAMSKRSANNKTEKEFLLN